MKPSQSQKLSPQSTQSDAEENQAKKNVNFRVMWIDMWLAPHGFMGSDESRTNKIEYAMVFKRRSQAERRIERMIDMRYAESRENFVIVDV